jgi:hypothetical protein
MRCKSCNHPVAPEDFKLEVGPDFLRVSFSCFECEAYHTALLGKHEFDMEETPEDLCSNFKGDEVE